MRYYTSQAAHLFDLLPPTGLLLFSQFSFHQMTRPTVCASSFFMPNRESIRGTVEFQQIGGKLRL